MRRFDDMVFGVACTLDAMQDFQNLRVWHEAHAYAVAVDRASKQAARGRSELINQLRRAADSIPANIAEGSGQLTDPQFVRFLAIALGSATESANHLMLARDTQALPPSVADDLLAQIGRIRRMLINLVKRLNPVAS